ncbi:MAG: ribonuclease HII [Gemmatimonadetes bacterium]|nr:ribonuclease HII [Gemmatimonadota bacterium]
MPAGPTLKLERIAWQAGKLLLGVDEAGRGPLAGPVVAAAVVFPRDVKRLAGIRDSKTLSEPQRDKAVLLIRKRALAIGIGAASVREIDRLNIRRATALAMRRAILRLYAECREPECREPECRVLLDGLAMPEVGFAHEFLIDGDALCVSISAAGIIAKTIRDRLMVNLARRHPAYHWVTNRGYGTEAHLQAIEQHGPTRHHRRTFAPIAQLGLGL